MKSKNVHTPYNRFKVWLKDNNLTYRIIADLLGITETSVAHKINGKSDFLLSEVQLIKSTYGVKDDIFFTKEVA